MKILGIHDGHNASACLLDDGIIVAAIEEERITRIKNQSGFPTNAINWILSFSRSTLAEIDSVALNGCHMPPSHSREQTMQEYKLTNSPTTAIKRLLKRTPAKEVYLLKRKKERISNITRFGFPEEKVVFVGHHLAHASAAYFGWGKMEEDVLVLTNDGGGDYLCATVNHAKEGKLNRLAYVHDSESIGNIYAMITYIMGMVPLEHEYKLMGMAPYAPESGAELVYHLLRPLMSFNDRDQGLTWSRTNGCPETYYSYKFFSELLALKRFDWICAGLQKFIEEILTEWVRNCVRAIGIHKIALGGGIFMNVKANKRIMELAEVDELFVFPSCGDESNSIGAAMWTYNEKRSSDMPTVAPIGPVYYGPFVGDAEISHSIQAYSNRGWKIEQLTNIEERVASLLAQGHVVARCKGRMEFGARALGNRSILADPTRPEVVRVINDIIKSRDFWMPFAPSILDECVLYYIVNPKNIPSPYMILSFDTTAKGIDLRAAIHPYDMTARPQVVYNNWNPDYYRLLKEFHKKTGRGVILNTSFNLHGYPIVMTANDALDVLDKSGLKYLALGNLLISK